MSRVLFILLALAMMTGCKKEEASNAKTEEAKQEVQSKPASSNPIQEQAQVDQGLIDEYVKKNEIQDAKSTASGLYYRVINEGNKDKMPVASSKVKVNYKGTLLNGQVFDESPKEKPISFGLDAVIPGWTEGLQLIGEGGTIQLIIPSRLAYGPRKISIIPANSVLVFDVDLLEVN